MNLHKNLCLAAGFALLAAACGGDVEDDHDHDHDEQEVISRVTLTFSPMGGGADVVAVWDDPDGDGGAAPTVDDITLEQGTYGVSVEFTNALEDPAEDITAEIAAEDDEHQVFFTGDAVEGPAASNAGAPLLHAYSDSDGNGDPLGLDNSVEARSAGTGTLTLTLRHLPDLKTSNLAADAASGGVSSLPGDTDVSVSFSVTVN